VRKKWHGGHIEKPNKSTSAGFRDLRPLGRLASALCRPAFTTALFAHAGFADERSRPDARESAERGRNPDAQSRNDS